MYFKVVSLSGYSFMIIPSEVTLMIMNKINNKKPAKGET